MTLLLGLDQGFAGTDVTGIEKGSFGRYYPEEQTEEQKVPSIQSQSEIPTLDEPLKVEKVKQEVEPQKGRTRSCI